MKYTVIMFVGLAVAFLTAQGCDKTVKTVVPTGKVENVSPKDAGVEAAMPEKTPDAPAPAQLFCYDGSAMIGEFPNRIAVQINVCAEQRDSCKKSRTGLEEAWKSLTEHYHLSECDQLLRS